MSLSHTVSYTDSDFSRKIENITHPVYLTPQLKGSP